MPGDFDDSSDYGSDFTPDEEELLNDLLAKVATGHATVEASSATAAATATATATTTTASKTVQATVTAVADIEDYAETPASQRVPKVLGREKPGFLWQKRKAWQVSTSAGAGPDQVSGNVCAASGEDHSLILRFCLFFCVCG
jgi:exonuclease V